jgi:uncharacterized protein (TIGR03435 family)
MLTNGKLRFRKNVLLTAASAVGAISTVVGLTSAYPRLREQKVVPRFEVVSIKPCMAEPVERTPASGPSPERLVLNCLTVKQLIKPAYIRYVNGRDNPVASIPIMGGPAWIDADRFRIEARADGPTSLSMMRGPMLQALLEDRFKLKIHQETREAPVYAVTISRSGHKLQPAKDGSCISQEELRKNPPPPPVPGQPLPPFVCGALWQTPRASGAYHVTLEDLFSQLSLYLDRPIVDKTGIQGTFDVHLDLADELQLPGDRSPDPPVPIEPGGPVGAIRAALQKLGLNLRSAKGPTKILVIDSVQRPTEN